MLWFISAEKWSLLVLDSLLEVLNSDSRLQIGTVVLLSFLTGGLFFSMSGLHSVIVKQPLLNRLISLRERSAYQKILKAL
jgi:MscS family membrane protein